jgi:hypothetical protein
MLITFAENTLSFTSSDISQMIPTRSLKLPDANRPMRRLWRRRTKRVAIQKTPMEKARIAAQRREKRATYDQAYAAAEAVVMKEATKISEQFGKHRPKQCYQTLLQRARISHKKRSPSRWNAYLHQEVRRKNDGMPITSYLLFCRPLSYALRQNSHLVLRAAEPLLMLRKLLLPGMPCQRKNSLTYPQML